MSHFCFQNTVSQRAVICERLQRPIVSKLVIIPACKICVFFLICIERVYNSYFIFCLDAEECTYFHIANYDSSSTTYGAIHI